MNSNSRLMVGGICLLLVAAVWLVFGQTLHYEFLGYDDQAYVTLRPEVVNGLTLNGIKAAFTRSYVSMWAPLTVISHMLDCQIFGLNAGGHHFTNIILHAIGAILLFLVLREMSGAFWQSAFVAAVFALHPLHVESVAWISERKDVLSGVFFMLTLGAYVYYVRQPSIARYMMVSILFALGLMAKPMIVTTPFVLLLLDYWPLKRLERWRALPRCLLEKIPLLIISLAASLTTSLVQAFGASSFADTPWSWRISNAIVSIFVYVRQTFWPSKLAAFYPHPFDRLPLGMVVVCAAGIVLISIAAVLIGKRRGYVPVGWFWFLGMLVPVLGFVQVGLQGHADRYTYLPQIGLAIVAAWGISDLLRMLPQRQVILGSVATIVCLALIWGARVQAATWRNNETLWRHAVEVDPQNHVAHSVLGDIEASRDHTADAIAHYEIALANYPDSHETHNKLALLLVRSGDPRLAIAHWKFALVSRPHDLNIESNLAWVLATAPDSSLRDGPHAIELMQDVIQRSGTRNGILLRTLAAAYAESGRFSEAITTAEEASDLALGQGNSELAADLRRHIDSYRGNNPWRDPSLENTQSPR